MESLRGRGRGRGIRRSQVEPELEQVPQGNPEPQASTSIGRGRGRGRGTGVLVPELPELSSDIYVELPENPEDDDFLDAFRRLNRSRDRGRAQGRGFDFGSIPSPSDSEITGNTSASMLSLLPPTCLRGTTPQSQDIGSEDYKGLERETVVRRGRQGKLVPIVANYVRLRVAQEMGLFEYHVDFEPEVESFRFKKKLLSCLKEDLGSARTFDGSTLYLATRLPDSKNLSFTVAYPNEPDRKVSIRLKFVKKSSLKECIHFYNVLFRRIMEQLGLVEMKRHFYNHRAVFDIPNHKLQIWPGYVTAINEYEGGLLLCCDSSFRLLQTATVLDVWNNFLDADDFETSKLRFTEYIVGKIVLTKYNNRHYRVDDVDWVGNPRSSFTNSKQQKMTFVQYYKNSYNLTIQDMAQPLLTHRPKPPENGFVKSIRLVPELCHVTGLEACTTSNYHVMKDVTRYTRLAPPQRDLALKTLLENVNNCKEAKSILDVWGLTLEEAGVNLEGRVLAVPQICNDPNKPGFVPVDGDFGNKVLRSPVFDPIPVRNWLLLYSRRDRHCANRMTEVYRQVVVPFGIAYNSNFTAIDVGYGSTQDFYNALNKHINGQVQFVVVVLPSQREDTYNMIKTVCTATKPIPSQVVLSKTLGNERKLTSIVQKIALQINCKLGGSLWTIRIPMVEKIMFIGIDVYHDPKRRNLSVAALVGSLNGTHTKYYSRVIFQNQHQETVSSMLQILMDLMKAFADANGGYPDRVIVWRDGVGDGQLPHTKSHEVTQFTEAFKQLSISPKFTFCVVQKRINTKLYLQGGHSLENPPPGTVVDHTVTRKYLYDFFLVSQFVREGTVTPSHYIVLEDSGDVPPDTIQKFAFASTFMYFNWTGSIKVPAMCQYAHKLAYLIGQNTRKEPSMEMADKLYYL